MKPSPLTSIFRLGGSIHSLAVAIRYSFWFIPSLIILAGFCLAIILPEVDRRYFAELGDPAFYIFGGSADAARSLLSTIASALSAVVSIAFSITIVALQQASSQYSPRALTNFSRDRINALVLGTYTGTVVYSLVVLRVVRNDTGPATAFVPGLSVTLGLLLAIFSLVLLVYFLHHTAASLRVSSILQLVRRELDEELKRAYPKPFLHSEGAAVSYQQCSKDFADYSLGNKFTVGAREEGYLREVNAEKLIALTRDKNFGLVWIVRPVGEHVLESSPLVHLWTSEPLDAELRSQIQDCFIVGSEQTIYQDALFGVKQIRDIALRALSPGVNDPSTAEECLDHLKGALAILIKRRMPRALHVENGTRYLINRPDFAEYLEASFTEIVKAAKHQRPVLKRFAVSIDELSQVAPDDGSFGQLLKEFGARLTQNAA